MIINFIILCSCEKKYYSSNIPKTFINISSFPAFQKVIDKIFNNPFKTYMSQEKILEKKLETFTNSINSIILFIFQVIYIFFFLKFSPFQDIQSFRKYWRHIPTGTRFLFIFMIVVHIFSIFFNLYQDNFFILLFAQNDYLTYVQKQFWRPLTSFFIHSNICHLLTILLLILMYCPIYEKYFGTQLFILTILSLSFFNLLLHSIANPYMDNFRTGFSSVIVFIMGLVVGNNGPSRLIHFRNERAIPPSKTSPSPPPFHVYKTDLTYQELFSYPLFLFFIPVLFSFLMPLSSPADHILAILLAALILYFSYDWDPNENIILLFNALYLLLNVLYFIFYVNQFL